MKDEWVWEWILPKEKRSSNVEVKDKQTKAEIRSYMYFEDWCIVRTKDIVHLMMRA